MYHYDFLGAEREFEWAIEINPRYATAHHFFGWYLCVMGRHEEAYTEVQRGIRLTPLSVTRSLLGYHYLYSRRHDQALKQVIKILERDPDSALAHARIGWADRGKR